MISAEIFAGLSDPPLLNNVTEEDRLDKIIAVCCNHLNLSKNDVLFNKVHKGIKDRPICDCRKLIAYYTRLAKLPVKSIEKAYPESKGFDHATIRHNQKIVQGYLDIKDEQFVKYIQQINEKLI